ncbi:dynamin family protein [Caldimonas thermodepolymerans]|uniref:dynamin family protein n=1 Tax=Caldimonas thermodepolymerans TaxID=215580 RepID=UPI002236BEED|nr:dynamin family protein [Caldimonas thermodepolymerans]UZG43709.1 dynamin family protein [Caldimonas thermodepolymerans]
MVPSFANKLDALGAWRADLESRLGELSRFLFDHDLLDPPTSALLDSLTQRLAGEKLVVAFVAEFSRGKSELINAIFFADTGRRILPATPGRTTMCPVELSYDPDEPPSLKLLDIDTRLGSASLAELRGHPSAWKQVELNIKRPDLLAEELLQVMQTRKVPKEAARELGFWDDDRPEDNPPVDAAGMVEVPAWRHAIINYPHPLLKRGLVVLDTPGLNAIGAEPELTVSLLPSAHATVFILAADTGVTKSDLTIWREHLCGQPLARYVALNKIDSLSDPLSPSAEVEIHIARQRALTAQTLGIPENRVFPISAKQALAGRVSGDADVLRASRILALEDALGHQLLPQRREVLERVVLDGTSQITAQIGRRLNDRRRQLAEQLLELRGLRGKNSNMVGMMLKRVEAESAEFEQCIARVQAMRSVHTRMLKDALTTISNDVVREQTDMLQEKLRSSVLNFGVKRAFSDMCAVLREQLRKAQTQGHEIHDMLGASFTKLNAEFGFGLSVPAAPDLSQFIADLDMIERNYIQYLGLSHALRLSQHRFMEQFRRMLVSKLRVVFEGASSELELWNKTASSQIDSQLRERRRNFKRRRESLERIQAASNELEARIQEVSAQEERLRHLQARLATLIEGIEIAATGPLPMGGIESVTIELPLNAPASAQG